MADALQIVRCARIPLPADSRAARTPPLARTARSAAVEQVLIDCSHHQPIEEGWLLTCTLCFLQLLRIEEGGAFAGLVGGSPSVAGAHSRGMTESPWSGSWTRATLDLSQSSWLVSAIHQKLACIMHATCRRWRC